MVNVWHFILFFISIVFMKLWHTQKSLMLNVDIKFPRKWFLVHSKSCFNRSIERCLNQILVSLNFHVIFNDVFLLHDHVLHLFDRAEWEVKKYCLAILLFDLGLSFAVRKVLYNGSFISRFTFIMPKLKFWESCFDV